MEKGYRVLISLVHNHSYDFVIEKDGVFSRVDVKVAGHKEKKNSNSWSISQPSRKGNIESNNSMIKADVYLVWLPNEKRFIELDGDFFIGSKSKSKLIPKNYL